VRSFSVPSIYCNETTRLPTFRSIRAARIQIHLRIFIHERNKIAESVINIVEFSSRIAYTFQRPKYFISLRSKKKCHTYNSYKLASLILIIISGSVEVSVKRHAFMKIFRLFALPGRTMPLFY
jgi:hypothetical protein